MASLETILNWVVPIGIVILFCFLLYRNPKIKEAVDLMFFKLSQLFFQVKVKVIEASTGTVQVGQEIVYG
jgi:hypothetical protein